MKLARLASTTQQHAPDVVAQLAQAEARAVRRVESMAGIDGDRERSVQQEIAEIEPQAIGDFAGAEQILAGARSVAAELTRLGCTAQGLIKLQALSQGIIRVDDSA